MNASRLLLLLLACSAGAADGLQAVQIGSATTLQGPLVFPGHGAWFERHNRPAPLSSLRALVRSAARAPTRPETILPGAHIMLADSTGRLWLVPDAAPDLLLGYDVRKDLWLEHRGLRNGSNRRRAEGFASRGGRLFFPDDDGVHVLDGIRWSYQPLFARNVLENNYYGESRLFNPPHFAQDERGHIYVWSPWGDAGNSGTIGYWMFDGHRWQNIDLVERLRLVVPQSPAAVWLLGDGGLQLDRDGKLLPPEGLPPGTPEWMVTTTSGQAMFTIEAGQVPAQAFVLAPGAKPRTLHQPVAAWLAASRGHHIVDADGRLCYAAGARLTSLTSGFSAVRPNVPLAGLREPQLRGAGEAGILYAEDADSLWRLGLTAPETGALHTNGLSQSP